LRKSLALLFRKAGSEIQELARMLVIAGGDGGQNLEPMVSRLPDPPLPGGPLSRPTYLGWHPLSTTTTVMMRSHER